MCLWLGETYLNLNKLHYLEIVNLKQAYLINYVSAEALTTARTHLHKISHSIPHIFKTKFKKVKHATPRNK